MDSEETYGMRLLGPLDGEPTTPSTVDIDRAMLEGRRRRKVRRTASYTAIATVTAVAALAIPAVDWTPQGTAGPALSAPESAAPTMTPVPMSTPEPTLVPPSQCELRRLPMPDGAPMGLVTGADPTGRFLVGRSYGQGSARAPLIWDNLMLHEVAMPGDDVRFSDVTSAGVAVGFSFVDGKVVPWLYRDGTLIRLPGLPDGGGAQAINEAGVIVGFRVNDETGRQLPVRWLSPTSSPVDLALPSDDWTGEAYDVDDDGTVVGTLYDGGANGELERGFVWRTGSTPQQLPMPKIDGVTPTTSRAFSIRNGWVTGLVETVLNQPVAMRWNVRTGEVRTFPQFHTRADTANTHGWMVGSNPKGQGLFLSDAGPVVLPDLAGHRDPFDVIATTVSDDGRTIAGQAEDAEEVIQAVVWLCQ